MKGLALTQSRYVRCVKPNTVKKPLVLFNMTTIEQLRCAGVVAAVVISRSAFPNCLDHRACFERFKVLVESSNDHRFVRIEVPRYHLLVTDEKARKYSLWALQFNVMTNPINTKLLSLNFAIMATPEAHNDSFSDTDPFDFNSATYFMPLASLLGIAIASIFTGQKSDRIGRKKVTWFCSVLSGFGSIGMYLARDTFWGFCGASFAARLFKGTISVAMAYVGDVYTTKKEKLYQLGVMVGCFVL